MPKRLIALVVLVLALAAPAAALAQGNPFGPLPGTPQPTETQPSRPSTLADPDDGMETWQQLAIFGGALALIAGIAFAILGDARRHAPASQDNRTRSAEGDRTGAALRKPPPNKAKQKQRRRTQKAARRKNR